VPKIRARTVGVNRRYKVHARQKTISEKLMELSREVSERVPDDAKNLLKRGTKKGHESQSAAARFRRLDERP
jgi:hypothetical protein